MIRWISFALTILYFWLYPSILLVPEEYRQGFWSADYNVVHRGVIIDREIHETEATFNNKVVYRVKMMMNGREELFWAANTDILKKLRSGDLITFETRGKVIVLANSQITHPVIVSLLNY